jgi:hypothetical protein
MKDVGPWHAWMVLSNQTRPPIRVPAWCRRSFQDICRGLDNYSSAYLWLISHDLSHGVPLMMLDNLPLMLSVCRTPFMTFLKLLLTNIVLSNDTKCIPVPVCHKLTNVWLFDSCTSSPRIFCGDFKHKITIILTDSELEFFQEQYMFQTRCLLLIRP